MSVPNTDTFSLTDVVAELGGGETSLQECFDNAITGGFDPAYNNDGYAPANSMLRFRNYTHAVDFTPNIVFVSRENTGTQIVGEVAILYDVTMTAASPLPVDLDNVISDRFTATNADGNGGDATGPINMNIGDTVRTQRIGVNYPVNLGTFDVSVNFPELGVLINEQPGNTITVPAL